MYALDSAGIEQELTPTDVGESSGGTLKLITKVSVFPILSFRIGGLLTPLPKPKKDNQIRAF